MNLNDIKELARINQTYWNLDAAFPSLDCPACKQAALIEELPHECSICGADRHPETMRAYSDLLVIDLTTQFVNDLNDLLTSSDNSALRQKIITLRDSWALNP